MSVYNYNINFCVRMENDESHVDLMNVRLGLAAEVVGGLPPIELFLPDDLLLLHQPHYAAPQFLEFIQKVAFVNLGTEFALHENGAYVLLLNNVDGSVFLKVLTTLTAIVAHLMRCSIKDAKGDPDDAPE